MASGELTRARPNLLWLKLQFWLRGCPWKSQGVMSLLTELRENEHRAAAGGS
jgi:hypothetical protein